MATIKATADNQTLDGTIDGDGMRSDGFNNVTLNGNDGNDGITASGGTGGEFNGGLGNDLISTGGLFDSDGNELPQNNGGVFNGDEGDDILIAGASTGGTFNGGDGNDQLQTAAAHSGTFNGDAGSDRLSVGGTDSYDCTYVIDGGTGTDTAAFFDPIDAYSFVKQGDTVVVTQGTMSATITNVETFEFWSPIDPEDPTDTTFESYTFDELPCFLPGTMIATPSGEVAIETLKAGDLVLTTEGEAKPVRWLARQTVSTRFANPQRVMPILIRAGALGMGVPSRDLYVSPDHALEIDGLLVHAEALVNGSSIVRHTAMPERFTYYHVELDDHSLILAEGTPAETFIDNVTRRSFDNWQEAPEAPVATELELPRVKSARQLPRSIRHWLAIRARALGHAEAGAA